MDCFASLAMTAEAASYSSRSLSTQPNHSGASASGGDALFLPARSLPAPGSHIGWPHAPGSWSVMHVAPHRGAAACRPLIPWACAWVAAIIDRIATAPRILSLVIAFLQVADPLCGSRLPDLRTSPGIPERISLFSMVKSRLRDRRGSTT